MKRTLKDFLFLQDHFGVTPNHLHKSKRQFHYLLSEIISLLINFGCIGLFILQLIELINREKPAINFVSLRLAKGPNITISDNLIIAFGVLDQQYQIMKGDGLFEVHANYEVTTIRDGIFSNVVTQLERINCTLTNLPEYARHNLEHEFYSNSLDNYYCFKQTITGDKIVLGGNFGSEFYGIMSFRVSRCKNSTSGNCEDNDVIDKRIKLSWFEVFFLDQFIDINNFKNPVQTYGNSFYTNIEPKLTKTYWAYFNGISMYSDHGILFDTNNTFSALKYENNKFDVSDNEGGLGDFIEFGLISSLNNEVYYRSYLKIQDIFAVIGGLLNGLNIVFSIVLGFIGHKMYNIELINNLFSFHFVGNTLNNLSSFTNPYNVNPQTGNSLNQKTNSNNDNKQSNTFGFSGVVKMHHVTSLPVVKKKKLMKINLDSQKQLTEKAQKGKNSGNIFELSFKEIFCGKITCGKGGGCCMSSSKSSFKNESINTHEREKIFHAFKKKIEFSNTILLQNEILWLKRFLLKETNIHYASNHKKIEELNISNLNQKMKFIYFVDTGNSVYNSNYNQMKNDSYPELIELSKYPITEQFTHQTKIGNEPPQRKSVTAGLSLQTPITNVDSHLP